MVKYSTSVLVSATTRCGRGRFRNASLLFRNNERDIQSVVEYSRRWQGSILSHPTNLSSLVSARPWLRLVQWTVHSHSLRIVDSKRPLTVVSFLPSFLSLNCLLSFARLCSWISSSHRLLCPLSLMGNPAFFLPIRRPFSLFGTRKCAARRFDMGGS